MNRNEVDSDYNESFDEENSDQILYPILRKPFIKPYMGFKSERKSSNITNDLMKPIL
jgi:hypothetical protein